MFLGNPAKTLRLFFERFISVFRRATPLHGTVVAQSSRENTMFSGRRRQTLFRRF